MLSHRRRWMVMVCTWLAAMGLLSGCSLLFGGGPEPTPAAAVGDEARAIVPTFTPTAEVVATATPEVVAQASVPTVEVVAAAPATATTAVTSTASTTSTAATTTIPEMGTGDAAPAAATPTPGAKAIVASDVANTRNGPGTEYGLVGPVTRDQSFDIVAKNADGSWWQICCVNGQEAWIFGQLVRAENAGAAPVAQNIPAPPQPVAAAPQPAAPTAAPAPAEPAPPADTPTPEPPAAAGAVNAGPCGGDDGCKFKIRGGPTKRSNGGGELKFQLFFIHSGVDGGQPQGDYRLGIEKDGQLITRFADATSIALNRNDGPMGAYNYEAKINASELPGGSVAGTYFFWVLDGNRERDSEVFRLDLAPDEGEVWIEFDQG